MKRVEGTAGVKLLECVNPVKNTWRVRWDVREREDGSADYMEENILGKPSREIIRTVILGWYNEEIDREILSGFVYEGMPVWLSSENQFNYKAVYDLAVQTAGASLPVTFKLGSDILLDLTRQEGYDISAQQHDCGASLYWDEQQTYQGGSGAACSALVFNSVLLSRLRSGEYKRILIAGTGALMSPTTSFQGDSIPAITHLAEVCI